MLTVFPCRNTLGARRLSTRYWRLSEMGKRLPARRSVTRLDSEDMLRTSVKYSAVPETVPWYYNYGTVVLHRCRQLLGGYGETSANKSEPIGRDLAQIWSRHS